MTRSLAKLVLLPWWTIQLATGAKSFLDNPLIGSSRLNALGLHVGRVRMAQWMTARRRTRLAAHLDPVDRDRFDRDGFVEIRDFLPAADFSALQAQVAAFHGASREMVQGHTITRRFAIDAQARRAIPSLDSFLRHPRWRALARYIASFDVEPLLYIQTILTHRLDGPPDPQINLHADTFYPAMKAWLFLEDVPAHGGPFTYVPGSHRLTPEREAWEKQRSLTVRDEECRMSARGSLRIEAAELAKLGLPPPRSFAVPANTLIVADTFGFHARGEASARSTRVELWAYGRRNPFRPFTGFDLWSIPGVVERRIGLRWGLRDRVARWIGQPWTSAGMKRPADD
ncbi:phytanoyl-CoA dioxygenase family protein [Sphingobium sp. AP49]|uniref:phytanoyl-CoA dioxygenase family protein n=1 Tax=Sphingobium sp. AP49 TaxID=1144307 RepID=UPI00026EDAA7|nr:phytanoyl-CoA dioxygenase family protein [Sphingobium sp. AP49]WHO39065.1 phytanoyl-CoA dioxygenase family protein [Sphingobium sp. AP49]